MNKYSQLWANIEEFITDGIRVDTNRKLNRKVEVKEVHPLNTNKSTVVKNSHYIFHRMNK